MAKTFHVDIVTPEAVVWSGLPDPGETRQELAEIADREELPLPTVGTWLRRGREELRRGLRPLMKELGADRQ